jgi:hypothetical protein
MSYLYVVLIIIFAAFIFFKLKRIFTKGMIAQCFVIDDKNNPYLLLLVNYEVAIMAKGMSFLPDYRLIKINLKILSVEYDVRIDKYNVAIDNHIKINDYFIFMLTDKEDLLIFDNRTGEKLSNRKIITKKNPVLENFNRELVEYNSILGTVIIFDNQGNAYALDPVTNIATQFDYDGKTVDDVNIPTLENLPSVSLDKGYSRINKKGKQLWKLAVTDIAYNPGISQYDTLSYTEFDKKLYFFYKQMSSDRMSISVVDKYKGRIIEKPKLFVNKRSFYQALGGQ